MNVRTTLEQSKPLRPQASPQVAVSRFLKDMKAAAEKTFPGWHKTLVEGIEECRLGYDARRAVLELHPLDDYYLAAAVALEAVKIRQLFGAEDASELLGLIGEQVDTLADRTDRVVSDMVFFLIGRIEAITVDSQTKPYDQVVQAILQRLGIDRIEATAHLIDQVIYRHALGEPLALGIPHWWQRFSDKYALAQPTADAPLRRQPVTVAAPGPAGRRRVPRRATAF